jgi:hypothetical protein
MTRKELFRRLQQKHDRERTARCRRLIRGINATTIRFYDNELGELEQIVERAYGRSKL